MSAFNLDEYIMHHVLNSREWHPPFVCAIHLPPPVSLHGLMLVLDAIFLIIIFCLVYQKDHRQAPTGFTNLLEIFVVFIRDEIAIRFLGAKDGRRLTPLFCTFFFLILTLNLMGLIPLFATATANINVTGALAFITFCFMILGGIYKNRFGFFKAFVPSGVPWPILFIVVPIEFVGVFIKSFALMIRLFANMLAGHIAIFSLLGLIVVMGLKFLPMIILALFIFLLEVFVSFLQAYIFTLLSAIFMGQMYHPEH